MKRALAATDLTLVLARGLVEYTHLSLCGITLPERSLGAVLVCPFVDKTGLRWLTCDVVVVDDMVVMLLGTVVLGCQEQNRASD